MKITRKILMITFIITLCLVTVYAVAGAIYDMTGLRNNTATAIFGKLNSSDIVGSIAGAFLGFGASLIIENIIISKRKKKSINNIVAEIKPIIKTLRNAIRMPKELQEKIHGGEEFDSIKKGHLNELNNLAYILRHKLSYTIYTPIWETILQNGDLLEFKEEDYFEELIAAYTFIRKLQILIDEYAEDSESTATNSNHLLLIMRVYLDMERKLSESSDLINLLDIEVLNFKEDSIKNEEGETSNN